jgi:transcriptional regulator with GAF, ATPase, and Fis domain
VSTFDEQAPFSGESLDFQEMSRDELQAKLFELLTLVETSRELLRARDADDVARRVLLSAIGVLGAGSACVLLRDSETETLGVAFELGLERMPDLRIALPEAITAAFVREQTRRPFRARDPRTTGAAAAFLHDLAPQLAELDPDLICPLTGASGLLGFLILGQRLLAEGYTASDLDLFSSLAELYVLALERAPGPTHPNATNGAPRTRRERHSGDNESLVELRSEYPALREILGESEAMQRFFKDLVDFADSRATLLIQGESGTGKELVANAIHEVSRRRNGPLEIVDCSSIPKELIESELFGHVRGAFTGAVRDRRGAFDLAHKGTILLDEIGEMTLGSQTRLLRVLQEGKIRPVGGEKTHSVDVRVIAATNVDLREAVRQGEFRKDLFYRIQVFPLRLPPLRERVGDIEVLLRAFLGRFSADEGQAAPALDQSVVDRLEEHVFPGNVRELQNIAEALAIRCRGTGRVSLDHLEDIFRSMQVDAEADVAIGPGAFPGDRGRGTALPPAQSTSPAATTPATPVSPGLAIGAFVLRAWIDAAFNLLEASRRARARRIEGEVVPITDRAQMSHYLDGELLRLFLEARDIEAALAPLVGGHPLRSRAHRRLQRLLAKLIESDGAMDLDALFPRMPEDYATLLAPLLPIDAEWLRAQLEQSAM